MNKHPHLHRMRQSGWFDILLLVLLAAVVLLALGGVGRWQHARTMAQVTETTTPYEIRQMMSGLATHKDTLGLAGVLTLAVGLAGLLWLRFVKPLYDGHLVRQHRLRKAGVALQYLTAMAYTLIILFPIYWKIISSLKPSQALQQPVPTLWPQTFRFENYPTVLGKAPFGLYLYNTLISTFFIMLGELLIGVLAAYGFSKGQFKGRDGLFLLVLGALMIPIQVTFVPIYVLISRLNWMNSFPGLIVPSLVSAYFIFMLRQTFFAVDDSYLEAGRVDGIGRLGEIFHILVPMCKPTIITVGIISFINGWNSYFWPKMITTNDSRRTIAVGVAHLRETFAGMETSNYNEMMAGAVMAIVPIVLLFLVLQKYIMTGFSKAAMK